MGRGDIMMTGKKRSRWGVVLFGLAVFALLYWAHETFLRRTQPPTPTVSIPSVGDAVQRAYSTLHGGFRDKVPLAEFAGMYHRMMDPDSGGELPEVRQAGVTDGTGPEHPVARFRVQYPASKAKAEYHFERIDGIWQLQSFTRVPSEIEGEAKEGGKGGTVGRSTPAHSPDGAKGGPKPKAAGEGDAAHNTAPAGGRPATPCDYIIQPGDTLGGISQHFYGASRYWRRILEGNPGLTERNLRLGRKIRIPSSPEPAAPREEPDAEPKPPVATTP